MKKPRSKQSKYYTEDVVMMRHNEQFRRLLRFLTQLELQEAIKLKRINSILRGTFIKGAP